MKIPEDVIFTQDARVTKAILSKFSRSRRRGGQTPVRYNTASSANNTSTDTMPSSSSSSSCIMQPVSGTTTSASLASKASSQSAEVDKPTNRHKDSTQLYQKQRDVIVEGKVKDDYRKVDGKKIRNSSSSTPSPSKETSPSSSNSSPSIKRRDSCKSNVSDAGYASSDGDYCCCCCHNDSESPASSPQSINNSHDTKLTSTGITTANEGEPTVKIAGSTCEHCCGCNCDKDECSTQTKGEHKIKRHKNNNSSEITSERSTCDTRKGKFDQTSNSFNPGMTSGGQMLVLRHIPLPQSLQDPSMKADSDEPLDDKKSTDGTSTTKSNDVDSSGAPLYSLFVWNPSLPPRPCCNEVPCQCSNNSLLLPKSALQVLHKYCDTARVNCYYQGGLSHDWLSYYERGLSSDQSCVNEWNCMAALVSRRPASPPAARGHREKTEVLIRSKLKEIMMSVDIDEVTSKYIRTELENELTMDLYKYKSYIDQEMLVILGQMDAATEIFNHVYLGSEWNASNLEELKKNGIGYILNVTMEIDNFYPGMFNYKNIRVYDNEKTDLLFHWEDTYRYINMVKENGGKVLVHCKMGISRSASVVIAYAMKAYELNLNEALDLVKKKRSCVRPNSAFCHQLKTYQGILDASRQRHNELWRSKSETNLPQGDSSSTAKSTHNSKRRSDKLKGQVKCRSNKSSPTFTSASSARQARPASVTSSTPSSDSSSNNIAGVSSSSNTFTTHSATTSFNSSPPLLRYNNHSSSSTDSMENNSTSWTSSSSPPHCADSTPPPPTFSKSDDCSDSTTMIHSLSSNNINNNLSSSSANTLLSRSFDATPTTTSPSSSTNNTSHPPQQQQQWSPCDVANGNTHVTVYGAAQCVHRVRPKSWSPDDRTTSLLFPSTPCSGVVLNSSPSVTEAEVYYRSPSLAPSTCDINDTTNDIERCTQQYPEFEQSSMTDGAPRCEVTNPLYERNNLMSIGHIAGVKGEQLPSHLQLSSSVRDRISEFENVKESSAVSSDLTNHITNSYCFTQNANSNLDKNTSVLPLLTFDNTVTSSSTDYYTLKDDVIEIPISATDEVLPFDPLTLRIKSEQHKMQQQHTQQRAQSYRNILPSSSSSKSSQDSPSPTKERKFQQDNDVSEPSDTDRRKVASSLEEDGGTLEPTTKPVAVTVPNENVTWRSGIVKRQKQDFEELVKGSNGSRLTTSEDVYDGGNGAIVLTTSSSCNALSGVNSCSPVVLRSKSMKETVGSYGVKGNVSKVDDPFSNTLDKVFAKEETKSLRQSVIIPPTPTVEKRESPSRNNSWGSFDSAVVLADREVPSRQSSWGSCDTRVTHPSRNSSFNRFDMRFDRNRASDSSIKPRVPPTDQDYFDKTVKRFDIEVADLHSRGLSRISSFSGSGNRRAKEAMPSSVSSEQLSSSQTPPNVQQPSPPPRFSPSKSIASVKTFGNISPPSRKASLRYSGELKTDTEKLVVVDKENSVNCNSLIESSSMPFGNKIAASASTKTGSVFKRCVELPMNSSASVSSLGSRSNSASPTQPHATAAAEQILEPLTSQKFNTSLMQQDAEDRNEEPVPGTVSQQRRKLESQFQETNKEGGDDSLSPNGPNFHRSLSSCSMELSLNCEYKPPTISRSLSEKREQFDVKLDINSSDGKVKKLTQNLEKFNSHHPSGNRSIQAHSSSLRHRSHSLEKLTGGSPASFQFSPVSPSSSESSSSQVILEQLEEEANMRVRDLEQAEAMNNGATEEVSVKKIVDLYENPSEASVSVDKNRPRADSVGEREVKPPVPQRKSSLDITIRSPSRLQHSYSHSHNRRSPQKLSPSSPKPPPGAPGAKPPQRASSVTSASSSSNHSFGSNSGASSSSCVSLTPSTSAHKRSHSGRAKECTQSSAGGGASGTASSSRQLCSTEMRQRKQQGKTHPLSRLPTRDSSFH